MGILERGIAILRMREVAETMRSVNALEKWVRGEGLGYRNEILHHDASNAWYASRAEGIQGALDLDLPIEEGQYLRGFWKRPEKYKFLAEATWYNPVTEQYSIKTFSMYSDYDAASEDLLEGWYPEKEAYLSGQDSFLVEINITQKWHRIGADY